MQPAKKDLIFIPHAQFFLKRTTASAGDRFPKKSKLILL